MFNSLHKRDFLIRLNTLQDKNILKMRNDTVRVINTLYFIVYYPFTTAIHQVVCTAKDV